MQKTAYEVRISDWSSDVFSSDLSQVVFIRIIALIRVSVGVITFIPIGIVGGGIILAVFDIVFILVVVLGWDVRLAGFGRQRGRSEEHTSELQSLMRISYAVFCLKKKKAQRKKRITQPTYKNQIME